MAYAAVVRRGLAFWVRLVRMWRLICAPGRLVDSRKGIWRPLIPAAIDYLLFTSLSLVDLLLEKLCYVCAVRGYEPPNLGFTYLVAALKHGLLEHFSANLLVGHHYLRSTQSAP